ncbi:DNA alkylation repair protein [Evansella sp. AB-P1]|uniref:DNA alkylation repair protein n=1 Tax=Evansella sp. AB-P1 TaxID=3037653 RepID=UPI00241C6C89|nr:DNA alkylation repair protein [Evansella sp. AB-P1]MDG5787409.1 DNA alkylation repair protein [Evansella sp. AB-P1]
MYENELTNIFSNGRNKEHQGPMEKYMKNKFPFLGIKTPERKLLLKEFYTKTKILEKKELPEKFLREVWSWPEREYQYAVISMLLAKPQWLKAEHVPWLEELITTKSWWDTIDTIASNVVGPLFLRSPHLIETYIDQWKVAENFWLKRTAILFQLKYKEKTNEELLFHIIQLNREDNEFFIRKAIGWALREYSKTAPEKVEAFIQQEPLSNLSVREGMKHLQRVRKNSEGKS